MGKKKKPSRKREASKRRAKQLDEQTKRSQDLMTGSQRGIGCDHNTLLDYDLEIAECPVRDALFARQVLELVENSYDAAQISQIIVDDTFVSLSGDEEGWTIPDTLADGTPVDPTTLAIATDVKERHTLDDYVVGSDKMHRGLQWSYTRGDAFLELGIEREGMGASRMDWGISKSQWLPTYEMFRIEDHGTLIGFEQRRTIVPSEADYFFYPPQIVHIRYNQNYLYGQSAFTQAINFGAWKELKAAAREISFAAAQHAQDQIKFQNDPKADFDTERAMRWREQYRQSVEKRLMKELFLPSWMNAERLGSSGADIDKLIRNYETWRYQIIPTRWPSTHWC